MELSKEGASSRRRSTDIRVYYLGNLCIRSVGLVWQCESVSEDAYNPPMYLHLFSDTNRTEINLDICSSLLRLQVEHVENHQELHNARASQPAATGLSQIFRYLCIEFKNVRVLPV